LDTGIDITHPDFAGRQIVSKSFINGEDAQDKNGHGTHCIGTACGPKDPSTLPRYGIAYNAEIFAGKVLSNRGSGTDGGILAGIEWAIASGCQVISMSLGAPTRPGDTYSKIYEQVGQRALQRGTLIIAAAGNESRDTSTGGRLSPPNPVGYPANAPSLMAVAALDAQLQIAAFSNGSINPDGGQIDIAGPGVNVYSTWPMSTRYRSISGTSMATPHVSGIAALYAEATGQTGLNLWGLLMRDAQRLLLPSADVGVGLVQAPM
jgi:subtilisin family serine protease